MPRRSDLPTREEMEGDPVPELGDAVATMPRKQLPPVVLAPPAVESVPPKRAVPTKPVEIPGVPYQDFVLLVMRSYLGGPLGLSAFSGTLLFAECPRLYRKMARLIEAGVWGDVAWAGMTDAQKRYLEHGEVV